MAKVRTVIHLECEVCKSRNYSKRVSKKRAFGKLLVKKYCKKCYKHNEHKETK